MSSNPFSKLNSALIIAILYNLAADDFFHCVVTCKLLNKYASNDMIISKLCHDKLAEILPSSMKTKLNTMIIPTIDLYSCDPIIPSELFLTLDMHAIGFPQYSKKWFLTCLMINIDGSSDIYILGKRTGYWLFPDKLFIGTMKIYGWYDSITKTFVKGMTIQPNLIQIGVYNGLLCTGFAISAEYIGSINHGKKHGQGKFIRSNGDVYTGYWINDKMEGNGKFTWTSGNTYDGQWMNDKTHGQGILTTITGIKYDGCFKANMHHGLGTIYHRDGSMWKGRWINDIPTSINALHVDMRNLLLNNQCTKIMADTPGKYCQYLYKHKNDEYNKSICQVCLNTCYLNDTDNIEAYWSIGNHICKCPCK